MPDCVLVSVEPGGVELCLFLDASVQLEDFSDCHSSIGRGRQGELHPQSSILPLCWRKERNTVSECVQQMMYFVAK